MEPSMIVVLGGILPFGSIFIEMYAYETVSFSWTFKYVVLQWWTWFFY